MMKSLQFQRPAWDWDQNQTRKIKMKHVGFGSGFGRWVLSTHGHYDCLGGYDKDFKIMYIYYSKKSLGASKQIPVYQKPKNKLPSESIRNT